MSDTDDTDLLLLIPPDFFLVRSPDLGFDSDCDSEFTLDNDEVKDSVVSDLIDHVNDLESRICLIESFDRSLTHCSTHTGTGNDDSIINQSVNSLTESDILRSRPNNNQIPGINLDVVLVNQSPIKGHRKDLDDLEGFMNYPQLPEDQFLLDFDLDSQLSLMIKAQEIDTGRLNHSNFAFEHQPLAAHKGRTHKELLNEVDSYLESKKSQKISLGSEVNSSASNIKANSEINESTNITPGAQVSVPGCTALEKGNSNRSYFTEPLMQDNQESIALPQVYDLLREMEQTQHDIEQKLKPRETCKESLYQGTRLYSGSISYRTGSSRIQESKPGLTMPLLNKHNANVGESFRTNQLEKYMDSQDSYRPVPSSNVQLSYLEPSVSSEGMNPNQDESKIRSSSPRKLSAGRSHLDIVKANLGLSRKDGKADVMVSPIRGDFSPRKNSSFRRHLNFENPNGTLRTMKAKASPLERNIRPEPASESQSQNEDRVNFTRYLSEKRSNNSIEDKLNAATATLHSSGDKPMYYVANTLDKMNSAESLEPKISSSQLLSLSELWNKEPTFYSDDPSKLRQKLEEEKYRRQHCEQQIQQLQQRALELQERLAVAVRVDQEKDRAITQMTQSWRRLNEHWTELEEQRHSLARQLQEEQAVAKGRADDMTKKIERWEKEVSQALDLAAGYKEKCEVAQKQMDLLQEDCAKKTEEVSGKVLKLSAENDKITSENKNLINDLETIHEKLKEEEDLLTKLKDELENKQRQCVAFEAEVNVLKEQKSSLIAKIRDEKNRSNILEQQRNSFQQALDEAHKREAAVEEARLGGERLEVARTELRALYQGQLEAVVREKLQEFQSQLEAAEGALRAELKAKERQWAERASDECLKLRDKHRLEVQRLEQARREETNKWKSRLLESERLRGASESRLQDETNRRADIAQRLHGVMETQWREALSIISNPMQNVYEVREPGEAEQPSSKRTNEEVPFSREGLVTSRPVQPPDHTLKKYIQMLLERGPGHPILNDTLQDSFDLTADNKALENRWIEDEVRKEINQNDRHSQAGKPPWK